MCRSWGGLPLWTKVMRKEARHTQMRDRASGVHPDILEQSITLEPGAQLELSGEQCATVHCARRELPTHVREIVSVGDELGIAFLGLGIQPVSRIEEIEWVPKPRYQVMGPYMTRVGTMGQRMMKQTATVQVNLDYSDERDAMRKFRVGMAIAPLLN